MKSLESNTKKTSACDPHPTSPAITGGKSPRANHKRTFRITIDDEMFGAMTGEFFGETEKDAIRTCKEFYALANDTNPWDVDIINVQAIN